MQTSLEPKRLERVISRETGLQFEATIGVDADGQNWCLLRPRALPVDHTFGIRTTLGWRRLRVELELGKFASSLLADMGHVNADGRSVFRAVLTECQNLGSQVDLEINGVRLPFDSDQVWADTWKRLVLSINKGQLELGSDDGEQDVQIVCRWTGRFAAAVVAILPTEETDANTESDVSGYPEGALTTIRINRYERNRRNRAAAIAIHGTACKACGLELGTRYGVIAAGLIDVHHVTPISHLRSEYVIDPVRDLVPLCPNCHAVAHRQDPPLTYREIRLLLDLE